jgi:cytochrome c oxidase subunit II
MDITKMLNLPIVASAHGHEVDMIIYLVHILMFLLALGWGIYFVVVLWRFCKKNNPAASYAGVHSHFSSVIEVAVVIFEVVLLVGFSIPFWARQVNAFPQRKDIIEVRVVAEQFAWNIHYPGPDGIFGETDVRFLDKQSNPLGLDPHDPHGKDDITTINQLHLPIGRPAVIYLTSRDVVHSFSLLVMRVKQDVIPGMSIPTWFTPTRTGAYEIACAQLCGLGHYRMKGFLTVHTQEEFDQWLNDQASAAQKDEGTDDFWGS